MSREINCKAVLKDNAISCSASLGQTVIVTEGPETYTGPVTVTPSESEQTLLTKDKLLTDNVTVNPISSEYVDAKADYDNALTAFGVESDLADGINALTTYSNSVTGEQDETLSDAVRSLADGYNKGLEKIETVNVAENTRSMALVPKSSWLDYDYLVISYDLTLSASDWLYGCAENLKTSGTSQYTANQTLTYKHISVAKFDNSKNAFIFTMPTFRVTNAEVPNGETLYLYTYSASKVILNGSSVTVYGGHA